MPKRVDITNEKYGKLTAIKYSHTNKGKKAVWECKCDCGNVHYATAKDLRSGNTKSCGCAKMEMIRLLKYKDGRCNERLYKVWSTMLKRCYNKNCSSYRFYGARGVIVCEEWKEYANFRNWAYLNGYDENAPRGKCTIDRIDSSGNYEPSNCRWVGMDVQSKNRRQVVKPYRNPINGRFASREVVLYADNRMQSTRE